MHDESPTYKDVALLGMNLQQGNEVASVGSAVGGVQLFIASWETVQPVATPTNVHSYPDWYLIEI